MSDEFEKELKKRFPSEPEDLFGSGVARAYAIYQELKPRLLSQAQEQTKKEMHSWYHERYACFDKGYVEKLLSEARKEGAIKTLNDFPNQRFAGAIEELRLMLECNRLTDLETTRKIIQERINQLEGTGAKDENPLNQRSKIEPDRELIDGRVQPSTPANPAPSKNNSTIQEFELALCKTCNQMTNHLGGKCMKHEEYITL